MSAKAAIRNFCIVAHIDHGKSTLADRMLEVTGTISKLKMQEQILDNMDLERERGITIKSHPIRMDYKHADGTEYVLNMIDTPGHVDFGYEVSRALAACEGVILLVDAAQGIEAQTLTNVYLAMEHDLPIIPVMNKVDLPSARPDEIAQAISDMFGFHPEEVHRCSAKSGEGVLELLDRVIAEVPPPSQEHEAPLQALIFDSMFDSYRGAVAYIRVKNGSLGKDDVIQFFNSRSIHSVDEVGFFRLGRQPAKRLYAGEVGYVTASIKTISDIKIGDTITTKTNPATKPIPGYAEIKPMVFSGIYPVDKGEYNDLRAALDKLKLNDASITYEPETSDALGFGFRTGFLGLLHMEVVQERLSREYDIDIITTVPNVKYIVKLRDGTEQIVDSPARLPDPKLIDYITEPFAKLQVIAPSEYIGAIMKLCEERRGKLGTIDYLEQTRVNIHYEIPLAEIVLDFFDALKSATKGYASMDYELSDYHREELVRLDIMINGEKVDAFSAIIHRDKAYNYGNIITSKLKELIPRQMFQIAIQAAIGSRVIARTTVRAFRKDVTSKCYGGDISRKRKLLEKQKEGKKRMKQVGNVEIPQSAFLAILSRE